MSMNTYLKGRLRNTTLHRNQGLMPLFEAVVNSIPSIAESSKDPAYGRIEIEILREAQGKLAFDQGKAKRGAPPQEPIVGFKISDNGIGFNEKNMESFETLDSDYKAGQGCRGVGRLLWLKAFEAVNISSVFSTPDGKASNRTFTFTATQGVGNKVISEAKPSSSPLTVVHLTVFERLTKDCNHDRQQPL
jgi:hypothetical protein